MRQNLKVLPDSVPLCEGDVVGSRALGWTKYDISGMHGPALVLHHHQIRGSRFCFDGLPESGVGERQVKKNKV